MNVLSRILTGSPKSLFFCKDEKKKLKSCSSDVCVVLTFQMFSLSRNFIKSSVSQIHWINSWIQSLIKGSLLLPGSFLCRSLNPVQTRTNRIFYQVQSQVQQMSVRLQAEQEQRQQLDRELQQVRLTSGTSVMFYILQLRADDRKSNCFFYSCFSGSAGSVGAAAADGGWPEICCST